MTAQVNRRQQLSSNKTNPEILEIPRFSGFLSLIDMKSSFQLHSRPSVTDDHGSEEERKRGGHRKEGQIFVSFQACDVKTNGNQAGKHHGNLPHDVALPVSSVVDHQSEDGGVHDEDSGREDVVYGPAAVSGRQVNGDGGQDSDQGQENDLAFVSGFSKDRVVEHHIKIQKCKT